MVLVTDDPRADEHFGDARRVDVDHQGGRASPFTVPGADFVSDVIGCLSEHGIRVTDFRTVLPTLEDVFLRLTGHSIRD